MTQCTLKLSKFADEHDLQLVEHVEIQINGFNSSKLYTTKIVQVPLVIGDKIIIINAVCAPSNNIELKIKGLNNLVSALVSEVLGDKTLLD